MPERVSAASFTGKADSTTIPSTSIGGRSPSPRRQAFMVVLERFVVLSRASGEPMTVAGVVHKYCFLAQSLDQDH
jgi:hypothetical protein